MQVAGAVARNSPFPGFDGLRFAAAISVLFSHAFLIAEGNEDGEPLCSPQLPDDLPAKRRVVPYDGRHGAPSQRHGQIRHQLASVVLFREPARRNTRERQHTAGRVKRAPDEKALPGLERPEARLPHDLQLE